MVGVSVALHLQRRGRDVVLIDRRSAGEETSQFEGRKRQIPLVDPSAFKQGRSEKIDRSKEC
jgi:D-amino-acid dehydrogenase